MCDHDWFHNLSAVRSEFEFYQLPILACIEQENGTELALKYMKYGATDYIVKPFGADELYARVNQSIDLQRTYLEIQTLSRTDGFTGLYNRRYFIEQGEQHYQAWLEQGSFCILVDIDLFKKINDEYGHPKGDEAIGFIASKLQHIFCDFVVARFGGEEFIVAGAYESKQSIIELTELFRQAVEKESVVEVGLAMTVSVGIGFNQPSFDKLVTQADQQLYRAKESGRNKVCPAQ